MWAWASLPELCRFRFPGAAQASPPFHPPLTRVCDQSAGVAQITLPSSRICPAHSCLEHGLASSYACVPPCVYPCTHAACWQFADQARTDERLDGQNESITSQQAATAALAADVTNLDSRLLQQSADQARTAARTNARVDELHSILEAMRSNHTAVVAELDDQIDRQTDIMRDVRSNHTAVVAELEDRIDRADAIIAAQRFTSTTTTATATTVTTTTVTTVTVATGSSTTATTTTTGTTTSTATTSTRTSSTTSVTSSTITTLVGEVGYGDIIINQLHGGNVVASVCPVGTPVVNAHFCTTLSPDQENEMRELFDGSIRVEQTLLATLGGRFPNLVRIANGGLIISGNAHLSTLDGAFQLLTHIGGALTFNGNPRLVIDGTELQSLRTVGGRFDPTGAKVLNGTAFPALEEVETNNNPDHDFVIRSHSSCVLESISGSAFPALLAVAGDFSLSGVQCGSWSMSGSAFLLLTTVGGAFSLTANSYSSYRGLRTITDSVFGALQTVNGSFSVSSNHMLESLSGSVFGNLTTVGGAFLLNANSLYSSGPWTITGSAFGSLATVNGAFSISSNQRLESLPDTAFQNLAAVASQFSIHSNYHLATIGDFKSP